MKIVLDIDALLAGGKITSEEYDRLQRFALKETSSLAFNILISVGVIATAVGTLALLPTPVTAIALGILLAVAGVLLTRRLVDEWGLLGSILLLVGSITAAGGIVALDEGGPAGFAIVTVLSIIAAIITNSVLLSIIATLSLSAAVGAGTAYGHATYVLSIQQPTLTVVLFSILAFAAYRLSRSFPGAYERVAITVSRTSLFLVNLGFWVGSLWGDSLWYNQAEWSFGTNALIPDWVFAVAWAVGLVAAGVWAARANKRWMVNLLAVFGTIHFYTQYFERLGAMPASILVAGLLAIAIAFGVFYYNKSATAGDRTAAQPSA